MEAEKAQVQYYLTLQWAVHVTFVISRLGSATTFQNMCGPVYFFTWIDKVVIRKKVQQEKIILVEQKQNCFRRRCSLSHWAIIIKVC